MGTKQAINSAYPVQAPNLTDPANIIDAIKLYHIGEGGTVSEPTSDSITAHLIGKANSVAPIITGTATFSDSVVLGSSNSDVVTLNANISASSVVVTPTQVSYLGSASNKTGSANLVFSTSPSLLTPSLDTPTITNTATFSDNVILGSSSTDTVTVNANISANGLTVTPIQLSYLNTANDKTGTENLVYSQEPTITTPTVAGSILTQSTSFDLVNANATTVNVAGAATAVNIGASTGTTTVKNGLTVVGATSLPANTSIGSVSATEIGYLDGATSNIQAQLSGFAGSGVPVGAIMMWYAATAPSGWIFCHGQSTASYPNLAAIIGANVPDLQTRVPVGRNSAGTGTFGTLGATGGSETVALLEANLPSHTHSIDHNHASFTSDSAGSHTHSYTDRGNSTITLSLASGVGQNSFADNTSGSYTTGSGGSHTHGINPPAYTGTSGATGSGTAHNNLQPYIVLNYIIKT